MHNRMRKLALLSLAGMIALGLVALVWAIEVGSSEAQQDAMQNCPQPDKWAISVWSGDDGTDAEQAFATCGEGGVTVAYSIDPDTRVWSRWFAGRPQISTLSTVDNLQGVIALGGAEAAVTPTPTPTPTPTLTATPSPTAVPLAGKQYVGEGDFGLDIKFTVCDDGTCLESLRLDWEACGIEDVWIVDEVPLEGDSFIVFEAEEMPQMRFVSGRFTSATTLEGHAIYAAEVWPGFACTNGLMEWEAHLKKMAGQ